MILAQPSSPWALPGLLRQPHVQQLGTSDADYLTGYTDWGSSQGATCTLVGRGDLNAR